MQSNAISIGSSAVRVGARKPVQPMTPKKSLYDRVGGRPTLEKVHKLLFDYICADPILGQFFVGVERGRHERQLTDFMSGAMGGPQIFIGKHPRDAHQHLYITDEMFVHRHQLLARAIHTVGVPGPLLEEWLHVDSAFRRVTVKNSIKDCHPQYTHGPIVVAKPVR